MIETGLLPHLHCFNCYYRMAANLWSKAMKNDKNSPPVPPQHQGRISNVDELLRAIEAYFDSCDDQGMS